MTQNKSGIKIRKSATIERETRHALMADFDNLFSGDERMYQQLNTERLKIVYTKKATMQWLFNSR